MRGRRASGGDTTTKVREKSKNQWWGITRAEKLGRAILTAQEYLDQEKTSLKPRTIGKNFNITIIIFLVERKTSSFKRQNRRKNKSHIS